MQYRPHLTTIHFVFYLLFVYFFPCFTFLFSVFRLILFVLGWFFCYVFVDVLSIFRLNWCLALSVHCPIWTKIEQGMFFPSLLGYFILTLCLFCLLWYTVLVLKFMPVKNTPKRDELISYLEKNVEYIIDYDRRKKTIPLSVAVEQKNGMIVLCLNDKNAKDYLGLATDIETLLS